MPCNRFVSNNIYNRFALTEGTDLRINCTCTKWTSEGRERYSHQTAHRISSVFSGWRDVDEKSENRGTYRESGREYGWIERGRIRSRGKVSKRQLEHRWFKLEWWYSLDGKADNPVFDTTISVIQIDISANTYIKCLSTIYQCQRQYWLECICSNSNVCYSEYELWYRLQMLESNIQVR